MARSQTSRRPRSTNRKFNILRSTKAVLRLPAPTQNGWLPDSIAFEGGASFRRIRRTARKDSPAAAGCPSWLLFRRLKRRHFCCGRWISFHCFLATRQRAAHSARSMAPSHRAQPLDNLTATTDHRSSVLQYENTRLTTSIKEERTTCESACWFAVGCCLRCWEARSIREPQFGFELAMLSRCGPNLVHIHPVEQHLFGRRKPTGC